MSILLISYLYIIKYLFRGYWTNACILYIIIHTCYYIDVKYIYEVMTYHILLFCRFKLYMISNVYRYLVLYDNEYDINIPINISYRLVHIYIYITFDLCIYHMWYIKEYDIYVYSIT